MPPRNVGNDDRPSVPWRHAWPLFRRLWPVLRPERRRAAGMAALMVVTVPPEVITPILVMGIFDRILPLQGEVPGGELITRLLQQGAWIIGLTVFSHGLGFLNGLLALAMRNRVRFRLQRRLFRHLLRLPLRYFHATETGYLMARVRDDVMALDALMMDRLVRAAVDLLRAIVLFSVLFFLDRGLALAGLSLVIVVLGMVLLLSPFLRRRSEVAREADARQSAALHESLAGLFSVRVAAREHAEGRRFYGRAKDSIRRRASRDVLSNWTGSLIGFVGVVGAFGVVLLGAYRILHDQSTVGSLFAFFMVLTGLFSATGALFGLAPAWQAALASLQRILEILDEAPETEAGTEAAAEIRGGRRARGRVEFREVSFSYGDGPRVLQDVSLVIEPGETVALVGRSGAGKSTLVHLLPRLFDPTEGRILLDGRDLRDWPLRTLREQIGIVPQDVFLFNRTIRENVGYASPRVSDERLRQALVAAHAEVFVDALEEGLDTLVGERGVRLSGGEKQRLALAREFLSDPPVLILDEATSNLDVENEAMIRDAIRRVLERRTCLVIAHRLSTVQNADRIAVLDEGRVVELGSHAELLERGGLYRELHDLQFQEARPEVDAG